VSFFFHKPKKEKFPSSAHMIL